jgi:hypothetical protein
MKYEETDIITRFDGLESGPIPQMSNTPTYLVLHAQTTVGQLDVRISEAAVPELVEVLSQHLKVRRSR